MESNSKVNRIHCSSAAAEILAKQAPKIPLRSRGMIPIKGKGEIHTYWVNEGSKSGVLEKKDTENMVGWAVPKRRPSMRKRPSLLGINPGKSAANFFQKRRSKDKDSKSSEFSLIRDSNYSQHSRSISIHSVDLGKVVEQLGNSSSEDSSSGEINFNGSSTTDRRSNSRG